ncbi:MAG: aminoacyl-tRNA hydrolase [Atribacterota bacterium]
MDIIVGLGNPGAQYQHSRHNIGFSVLEKFVTTIAGTSHHLKWKKKFFACILNLRFQEKDLILVKPQTFMNLSGRAVKDIFDYYDINYSQLLVIYDDFHLPLGRIRIRERGSSGGHHGMDSIISYLQSEDFPRLRIGIRNDKLLEKLDYSDFVLTNFLPEEKELVENTITRAVQALQEILNNGYQIAMREFN